MVGNKADVTVCTATIPSRAEMLERAIDSVKNQTLQPKDHIIKLDDQKQGQAAVLDSIVEEAQTKYVMMLDDDDEFLPIHIQSLYAKIEEEEADLVYPHFRYATRGDAGHLEQFFNEPWDNRYPHQVPLTWICRTDVFLDIGGFSKDYDPNSYNLDEQGNRIGHDYLFILRLVQNKKRIVHLPRVTWVYHDDRISTLGMPSRWS
jgi:glycosyltransferase involved in cell wall biosynthesis